MSESASEHDRPNEGEASRDSSERGQSHRGHRHRRRRRHKKEKPTSKPAAAAFVGLILIVGAGLFYALGPRLALHLKAAIQQKQKINEGRQYIALGPGTVRILNSSEENWGYTTVTVNDKYESHASGIPKGTQFEIWLKSFLGPNGERIDLVTERVISVKVQPAGHDAIVWTPPIE